MLINSSLLIKVLAILSIISFIIDYEIIFSIFGFWIFHFKTGLLSFIDDYIHTTKLKWFYGCLIRIILLENLRYFLEILN